MFPDALCPACKYFCFCTTVSSRLRSLCRLQRIQGHMVSHLLMHLHVKYSSYRRFTVLCSEGRIWITWSGFLYLYCIFQCVLVKPFTESVLSCLCFGSDVESGGTRGSSGESGQRRCDHHKPTQSPERPQPDHDPTDLPSAQGMWEAWFMLTSTGSKVMASSVSSVVYHSSVLQIVNGFGWMLVLPFTHYLWRNVITLTSSKKTLGLM